VLGGNLDGFTVWVGDQSWTIEDGRLAAVQASSLFYS
jgi:hypothetical protein